MAIYNDSESINVRVEAEIIPDEQHHQVRYDVRIFDLNGVSDQNIQAFRLYHDTAYTLMKLAGVPWRDANQVLSMAYQEALRVYNRQQEATS